MSIAEDTGATPASGSIYLPTDITPENLFQALGRLRKEAFDEIERLLCFLDECDGEDDLEPSNGSGLHGGDDREGEPEHDEPEHDEPTLGWTETEARWGKYSETNEQHEGEPSLASVNSHHDQTSWSQGNSDEREGDGCADDREGDERLHGGESEKEDDESNADDEPSLGWTTEGVVGQTSIAISDGEEGEDARAPQNRNQVPSSVDAMKKLRGRMRRDYLDVLRFDNAMASLKSCDPDVLKGGQLSYPGGQAAFDQMMKGR